MKQQKQDISLFVAKALVFLYIILSPFIDHQKYLKFLDNIAAKVMILVIIIIVSFFDFQLSVLLTIALFVLIINLNKNHIAKLIDISKPAPYIPPSPIVIAETTQPIMHIQSSEESENFQNSTLDTDVVPYTSDIMFNFPDASCNTKAFAETGVSDDMLNHYIDPKIKPYEVYIQMMTSKDKLADAQNNMI